MSQPADGPQRDQPPGGVGAIEVIASNWNGGIVIFHPDARRMGSEWIESDEFIEDVRERK